MLAKFTFNELPKSIQTQIQNCLLHNNFPEAKELYDQFRLKQDSAIVDVKQRLVSPRSLSS